MAGHDTDHGGTDESDHSGMQTRMYLRFGAMILTAMVVVYWTMFAGSREWGQWSQSRLFMAVTMGGTMGLVMLAWMLNMYENTMANIIVVVGQPAAHHGGSPWTAGRRRRHRLHEAATGAGCRPTARVTGSHG